MPTMLLIETATATCTVGVSIDHRVVSVRSVSSPKVHASVINVFIDEVLHESNISMQQLQAVVVSKGPGSYTGLRIGVSSAKGICYALGIPLIAVDTLHAFASTFLQQQSIAPHHLLAPMIDARRMEVYTSILDSAQQVVLPTQALILDMQSFHTYSHHTIHIFGDGAAKCVPLFTNSPHCIIHQHFVPKVDGLLPLALAKYHTRQFEDTAYFEPFYLKNFVTQSTFHTP